MGSGARLTGHARVGLGALEVFPLCLGTNVFGWTVDERDAFTVLDAYVDAGGNFIDTADGYSEWIDGNVGGESETIIGRWLASRGCRDEMVIATKVGAWSRHKGLAPATTRAALEESLRRLQTDRVDLYYAHRDDEATPFEESLGGFHELVSEGKVREIGASNFTASRLAASLEVSDRLGLARFVAIQPRYSLLDRSEYEDDLQALCGAEGIGCVPYQGLAQGFLTGKYRLGAELPASARAEGARAYLDARGLAALEVLDEIAAAHATTVAAVALAWLRARVTVVAPIASARTVDQLADLTPMVELVLSVDETERIDTITLERTDE